MDRLCARHGAAVEGAIIRRQKAPLVKEQPVETKRIGRMPKTAIYSHQNASGHRDSAKSQVVEGGKVVGRGKKPGAVSRLAISRDLDFSASRKQETGHAYLVIEHELLVQDFILRSSNVRLSLLSAVVSRLENSLFSPAFS